MSYALHAPHFRRPRPVEVQVEPGAEVAAGVTAVEQHRWLACLAAPFTAMAAFLAASMASGDERYMIAVVVLGPIAMMVLLIYLAISSDANRPL